MLSKLRVRRGRHRRRLISFRRPRERDVLALMAAGWDGDLDELVRFREKHLAAVGRRHGTDGWPT